MRLLRPTLLTLVLSAALAGCSQPPAHPTLMHVPADTPYVFATLERFPDDVAQAWIAHSDATPRIWSMQLQEAIDALGQDGADSALLPWLRALQAEIDGKTLQQLMAATGVRLDAHMALYGVGLAPVYRVELADPAALPALVARLEATAGQTLPTRTLDGHTLWSVALPDAPLHGVFGVIDGQLVATLAPAQDDASLRTLLGLDAPEAHLGDGKALAAFNTAQGFDNSLSGYLDSARLFAVLQRPATPLETAFLAALGIEAKPAFGPGCADELASLAATWPRIAMGYTRISKTQVDTVARIETSPALARDLMTLRTPMPGAALGPAPLAGFGLAIKLDALPALFNRHADAVAAAPWTCEALAPLNAAFKDARPAFNNAGFYSVAPMASAISLRLDALDFDAARNGTPSGEGSVAIATPQPAALVALAAAQLPALAALKLQPDGQAQRIEGLPGLPEGLAVEIAMRADALGVSVGAGGQARLDGHLALDPARQPLLQISYSGQLMGQALDAMDGWSEGWSTIEDDGSEDAAARVQSQADARAKMKAQNALLRELYANAFEQLDTRIELTERGIEIHQDIRMR